MHPTACVLATGVTLPTSSQVRLNLNNNELTGTLPPALFTGVCPCACTQGSILLYTSAITGQRRTFVNDNLLTGGLPADINCSLLEVFICNSNLLSGAVPWSTWTGCSQLKKFALSHNNFEGAITGVSALTKLTLFTVGEHLL